MAMMASDIHYSALVWVAAIALPALCVSLIVFVCTPKNFKLPEL
jgi:hypothetical protein